MIIADPRAPYSPEPADVFGWTVERDGCPVIEKRFSYRTARLIANALNIAHMRGFRDGVKEAQPPKPRN